VLENSHLPVVGTIQAHRHEAGWLQGRQQQVTVARDIDVDKA
jgi:hypothetical protein